MKLDPSFIWTAFVGLLSALPTTLYLTAVSVVCGFAVGTAIALLRLYRVPVLHPLAAAYVTFIRGTPMLTHLLIVYFGLPILIDSSMASLGLPFRAVQIPLIGFAYISFTITASAYLSEVVRSGLLAVDKGQTDAAYAIGMTTVQSLRRIVFPQALAVALPNLSSSVIGMLHATTLAFAVSVVDINAKAQIVASTNWKFAEAYVAAALLFWGLTFLIERVTGLIERRIHSYNKGGVA